MSAIEFEQEGFCTINEEEDLPSNASSESKDKKVDRLEQETQFYQTKLKGMRAVIDKLVDAFVSSFPE